jgi:hypothetical protein
VHHQHRARVAQVLDHLGARVVADQLRVPVGGGQQPLHPVGVGSPARLGAAKPPRDPGVQALQPGRPRLDFLDVCRLVGLQHRSSCAAATPSRWWMARAASSA